MKTTPEPPDPFKLPPKPQAPKPQGETWSKTGTKGIEKNQDGKLRTNIPLPTFKEKA